MATQLISIHEALERLRANPAFDAGSAYTRTKLYCESVTMAGQKIPYWGAIREAIGKGSATDINRGIRDFRAEHAAKLTALPSVPPDVPEELVQPLVALWDLALQAASGTFDEERKRWLDDIQDAEATAEASAEASRAIQAELAAARHELERTRESLAATTHGLDQAQLLANGLQLQLEARGAELVRATADARAEREAFNRERNEILAREDETRRSLLLQLDKARADAAGRIHTLERDLVKARDASAEQSQRLQEKDEDLRRLTAERDNLVLRLAEQARQQLRPEPAPRPGPRERLLERRPRRR